MRLFAGILAIIFLAIPSVTLARVFTLDFEGIAPYPNNSDVQIQSFYNGGTSSIGSSGPNLGVEFSPTIRVACLSTLDSLDCSGSSHGGFGIPTSARSAMLYSGQSTPFINVADGFDTALSYFYQNFFGRFTTVSIFDGLNGTGNLLATVRHEAMLLTNTTCDVGAYGTNRCPYLPHSMEFNGVARSVVFGGELSFNGFSPTFYDDLTFGSTVIGGAVVPEPQSWALLIIGFGLTGAAMRRRQKNTLIVTAQQD